jgi:acetoin utilization deacetylase AcuC-like enzyme
MRDHDPGAHHPEAPERLRAACDALEGMPGLEWRSPQPAERAQLARVHTNAHIDLVDSARGKRAAFDPDTTVSSGSVDAAYLAAGAAVDAVTEVVRGEHRDAFALVRPPGHHAESHVAMGFCLFNNVAVAAEHARAELGCERVLIVDWDVHHGNGTQHSFYGRDDVLFFSLHQFPFYPGTGALEETGRGPGEGYTVNVPFPAGRIDGDYLSAFRNLLEPIADTFAPDLVLVSAGFDAHRNDPLAGMRATEEGYSAMAATVKAIADRHAQGRLVLLLEGGYDLGALGRSVRAVVETLTGATPPEVGTPTAAGDALVGAVARAHRAQWKL